MRAVVQRVKSASVSVGDELVSQIWAGLLVLVGAEKGDSEEDVSYIASKICGLRVFPDSEGKMNLDIREYGGEILIVSQFTLAGDVRKGRRPSFASAETPELARGLVERLVRRVENEEIPVKTGRFQAYMDVALVNDGPITILLDSRKGF